MKKIITSLFALLFVSYSLSAQLTTNLVFFSEQGEQFSVVLNGIQQNAEPQTNIKVTDLIQPYYKVKIIFKDPNLGQIDKTLNFNQGTETTYCLKQNKKGEYVIRWQSEIPIAQAPPPAPNQNVIVFSTSPPAATTVTHTQTTTTVNDGGANDGNVNMGVNVNDPELGVNFNMNVNVNDPNVSTSSQTTTTVTTTESYSSNNNAQTEVYVMPGYNGPTGCPWPMDEAQFGNVYNSIASKDWDETKLTVAKQVISSNCLTSEQVKQIMLLFEWEDTRLDLAKWAYGHTFDIGNYYLLNDAFEWESSITELNAYINGYQW
jgi:hypothetical protein